MVTLNRNIRAVIENASLAAVRRPEEVQFMQSITAVCNAARRCDRGSAVERRRS